MGVGPVDDRLYSKAVTKNPDRDLVSDADALYTSCV